MTPTQIQTYVTSCSLHSNCIDCFDQHSVNFTCDTHSQAQFQLAMNLVGGEFVDCVREQVRVWLPARAIVKNALDSRLEVGRDCGCHD